MTRQNLSTAIDRVKDLMRIDGFPQKANDQGDGQTTLTSRSSSRSPKWRAARQKRPKGWATHLSWSITYCFNFMSTEAVALIPEANRTLAEESLKGRKVIWEVKG
jgi:hypothetical protein